MSDQTNRAARFSRAPHADQPYFSPQQERQEQQSANATIVPPRSNSIPQTPSTASTATTATETTIDIPQPKLERPNEPLEEDFIPPAVFRDYITTLRDTLATNRKTELDGVGTLRPRPVLMDWLNEDQKAQYEYARAAWEVAYREYRIRVDEALERRGEFNERRARGFAGAEEVCERLQVLKLDEWIMEWRADVGKHDRTRKMEGRSPDV